MGDFSEEMFLDYISAAGGKVKNADLLKTYKHFFNHNDKQLRAKYREEFKLIIDKIAVVKSENGEKYLVLKKKYKQLMLERRGGEERQVAERERESDNETQASLRGASGEVSSLPKAQADLHVPDSGQQLCPPTGAASSRTGEGTQANTPWCEAPVAMVTEVPEPTVTMQEIPSTLSVPNETTALQPEVAQNTTQMGEPGEDTGSKSDSEPEEEATGSMESPALALDPLEKEWMQSAAHGQLSNLSELLKQEPSLAHKKDFTSGVSEITVFLSHL
ncbi:hypothetical protein MATL_G00079270 [Megalops atlanticus]|uniref:SOWAHA-C winged helix-turn-helix domain-containing protein n=1 Tax=Megalops atlanticus TaxID=7932 RepID=A0A9D3TGV8_MEGAT|nr:hypothetical protein MATL_G00079270 [Megalops atlanticus]